MFEVERIEEWRGQPVVDPDGDKVGKLEELYTDLDSGEPGIGCVKTGLFGRHLSLVPLREATLGRDYVRLPGSAPGSVDSDSVRICSSLEGCLRAQAVP